MVHALSPPYAACCVRVTHAKARKERDCNGSLGEGVAILSEVRHFRIRQELLLRAKSKQARDFPAIEAFSNGSLAWNETQCWLQILYQERAWYMRRHPGINCSICESTYAWFRNYARVLNEMGFRRHAFLVFSYVRRRNDNLSAGDVEYLNAFAPKFSHKRLSKPYRCW